MYNWLKSYRWYVIFFILGAATAWPCATTQIHNALEISGVLMLVALFASLLVPFAAFSEREQGRKFLLQNLPLVAFGSYSIAVVHDFNTVKLVLLTAAMGMHLSYWTSSIHSRAYRMHLFEVAFSRDMPELAKAIAAYAGCGRSDYADELVRQVLSSAVTSAGDDGQTR